MYTALVLHGLTLLAVTWWVTKRCRSVVNPVTYFAGFYTVQTVLSPFLYGTLGLFDDTDELVIAKTALYSSIYFVSIALPFLARTSKVNAWMHRMSKRVLPRPIRITNGVYVAIILQLLLFFILLIISSGTTQWVTEPRVAYEASRAGSGVFWSQCQCMLVLLAAAFLARKPRGAVSTLLICAITGGAAYFLGSKSFMLFPFILAAFYYEHTVKPIPRLAVALGAGGMALGVFVLQLLQGTATSVVETIAYFDYFPHTSTFLEDFGDRFHHTWGATWLSNVWQYIPRGLYPGKPFVYGQTSIMEEYNQGAAELGATPGILPWAASYLDFGVVGVIVEGLLSGVVARFAFFLLKARKDLVAILLFGQVGLITSSFAASFYGAPFLLFLAWLTVQIFWLRIVAGPKRRPIRAALMPRQAEPVPD